jgi:hypothetical protein
MTQRQEAAVRDLARTGVLTGTQVDQVLSVLRRADAVPARRPGWWLEILGYVGAGLLLAGAGTLVGGSWDVLSRAGKVALVASVSLALLVAGAAVGRGCRRRDGTGPARRRIAGTLLALASVPAALAAGVAVGDDPVMLAPLTGLVVAVGGYAWLRSAPGLLVAALFSALTAATALDGWLDGAAFVLVLGAVLITIGAGWIGLALAGIAEPRRLALGVGAAIALCGAQQPLAVHSVAGWGYSATIVVAGALLALYRRTPALVLLVAGVVGVTVAVPEAVWDITDGAGGAAAILLVSGAVLLTTTGAGLWLRGRGGPAATRSP